jgi:hypothetical protein
MHPGANLPGCIIFLSSNQSFCTICSFDPRCENQKEIVLELKQLRATIQTVRPDIVEESSKGVSCQSCSPGQKKLVVRVLGLAAEARGGVLAVNYIKKWTSWLIWFRGCDTGPRRWGTNARGVGVIMLNLIACGYLKWGSVT